jgi:two-component system NtrC family sensor kinase
MLPASEVRLRAGQRRSDEVSSSDGVESTTSVFAVTIPWTGERHAVLEVLSPLRPPAELRPILDAVAALIAAVLPVYTAGVEEESGLERQLHRLTIDALPVGLYVVNRDLRIVLWNRRREIGTQGLRREDVIGRQVTEVLHRQAPDVLAAEFEGVFTTGEAHLSEQDVEIGGERRRYRTSRLPMRVDGDAISHVMTLGEDMTETHALQRAMHQTEKLAAVGTLAAGVMHEINNPLATIGACVAAISARLGKSAEPVVGEYLDIIESEVTRCTNIIDGLLDFSRAGRDGGAMEPTDLNALLERTLYLLKHHQRFRRLHVTRELSEHLAPVLGNGERLIQAAMAILLNAADASNGRGAVIVRTIDEGSHVVAEFHDDGPGIPADILPKIFDPFFTTKGPSRGTGLGLAICYGIVADHRGRLEVRSEPGKGTTFRMSLPRAGGTA